MILRNILSLVVLLAFVGPSYAQCPTGVPPILGRGASTFDIDYRLKTPTPTFNQVGTGHADTEYFVTKKGTTADIGSGPMIVGVDNDGVFLPSEFGIGVNDTFCITPVIYDLSVIQNIIQELLTGSTQPIPGINVTCCAAIPLALGISICDTLNSYGITKGSDVGSLSDIFILAKQFIGGGTGDGSLSIEGFQNSIDSLNAAAGGLGISDCGINLLPICYKLEEDSALCYTVTCSGISFAGQDDTIELCQNIGGIDLLDYVKGNPDSIGIFFDPNGDPVTNKRINTKTALPGLYKYLTPDTAAGCIKDSSYNLFSFLPSDDASFSYGANRFCNTDPTDPTATISGTSGGSFWGSTGMAVDPVSGTIDISATTTNTQHQVAYTTTGNCPATDTLIITIEEKGVNPLPNDTALTICYDMLPYNINPFLQGSSGGFWYDSSGTITSPVLIKSLYLGDVIYDLNNYQACEDDQFRIYLSVVNDCISIGMAYLEDLGEIRAFPNPSTGVLEIEGSHAAKKDQSIVVLNLLGIEVLNAKILLGDRSAKLDLSELPAGNYFIRIGDGAEISQLKVIKH